MEMIKYKHYTFPGDGGIAYQFIDLNQNNPEFGWFEGTGWKNIKNAIPVADLNLTLDRKMNLIFNSGYSISIQNEVKRINGEWENRITWKHIQTPGGEIINQSIWEGFDNIKDCVDDCLKYIKSNENRKNSTKVN
jgi:hypothetical protein